MKTIIALSLSTVLLAGTSGCSVNDPNMSDSERTKSEGALTGAAGGALLGAIFGSSKKRTRNIILGTVVGGAAGYAYGTHVAKEKAKYAKEEDWLDACVVSAKKVNNETRAYNVQLSREITKTQNLVQLYKQKKIQKSQLLAQKRNIDKQRTIAKAKLDKAQFELENQQDILVEAKKAESKNTVSHARVKNVENEIAVLKKQINELKVNTSRLASVSALAAV